MIAGPNIFLCGFMGSGKSTHGKRLARLLRRSFVDLDQQVERSQDETITAIFAKKGEDFFRQIETEQLKKLIDSHTSTVISLGGGTPCFNNNLELILGSGTLIYIKMDEKSLYQRVVRSKKTRPLLQDKSREELLQFIHDLVEKREPYYAQAQLTVNGIDLKTEALVELLKSQHLVAP